MNLARAYFEQALREQRRHDQGWERSARRASAQAAVCLRSPHPQRRVEAATVAGGVSAIRGDTSAAGRMLVGVVGLLDQIDAPATVARHLILLGLTLRTSGHAADALPWLRWAVELDSRITDLGLVARCHYELAKAYRDLGDLALALQHFEHGRAIEFRRSSDHVNGLVTHLVGQAELASAHRHLVKTSDALEDQARLDPLTGVPNRLALSLYVAQLAADDNPDVAALFVDIDHFKVVNDTGGHAAGDEVLRSIAKVVQDALRGDDQIFRYGGDEFVVLLPGTDASMAHDIAERIRSSVSDACATVMGGTTVTVSVGCCVGMGTDASSVIAGADAAVYLAKRAGRNRVAVSAPRPPMSI